MNKHLKKAGYAALLLTMIACGSEDTKETTYADVVPVAAMRQVMWQGEVGPKIKLDTLKNEGLYGLGPLSYLKGEILLLDGKPYVSRVADSLGMVVEENPEATAPFFVYAVVREWQESALPDTIGTLKDLESYLDHLAKSMNRPFAFRLKGVVRSATIHTQNLPEGVAPKNPQEAHQGQANFQLEDEQVEALGFFSRKHQGVFTHHDSYVHIHLINSKKDMMGHLDDVVWGEMTLFLPPNVN